MYKDDTRVMLQHKFIEQSVNDMSETILKFYATMALNDCYNSMSDEQFTDFIVRRTA